MAVYKRGYRGYAGGFTAPWSRLLVIPRYAFKQVFQSKLFTAFFVACFFFPLGCGAFLYVNHNTQLLALFNVHEIVPVDAYFFYIFLQVQGTLAFVLAAFVGPGLIAPDLANNALPLYLCRPFSRAEYVAGKLSVLCLLLSAVTWAPGLILYLVQTDLAGTSWLEANLWMAGGIFLASWVRIVIFSVLAIALSAWIRWRVVAGAALLAVFFVSAGFGVAINAVLETRNGALLNLGELIATVERDLFRQPLRLDAVSPGTAWLVLIAISALCLMLLARKVRAYEVVRG